MTKEKEIEEILILLCKSPGGFFEPDGSSITL